MEEYWDAFNANRRPLYGITLKRGNPIPEGYYHTVVHIIIFNRDGLFLSQQRTPNKTFPEMWDITVGGSALAGETSQQAAHRELKEELGLDRDFSRLTPVFTVKGTNYFDDYYYLFEDTDLSTLHFQPDEVQSAAWKSFAEAKQEIETGDFIPYDTLDVMEFMYLKMIVGKMTDNTPPIYDKEGINYVKYQAIMKRKASGQ